MTGQKGPFRHFGDFFSKSVGCFPVESSRPESKHSGKSKGLPPQVENYRRAARKQQTEISLGQSSTRRHVRKSAFEVEAFSVISDQFQRGAIRCGRFR